MVEPTSTTTATAWAVAAGAIGAFLAAIGVGWADVFWGVLGTLLGGPVANSIGRWRAMAAFPASAMLSAKFGAFAAGYMGVSSASGGFAALIGIFFQPLFAAGVQFLPTIGSIAGSALKQKILGASGTPPTNGDSQ